MEHYTDDKEALSVTREIEELVPALAGEWGRDLAEGLEELIATFEGLLVQRSCDSAEA